MKKQAIVLSILLSALLTACAAFTPTGLFESQDLNPKWESGEYIQKVENFAVILDASQSMNDPYGGVKKFHLASGFADAMNRTIPNLELQAALRYFGFTICPYVERTEKVYGLTTWDREGFGTALAGVDWAGGNSPLAAAITATGQDLAGAQDRIAVIVISDGIEIDDSAVAAAQSLKSQFGDRLCIYTVQAGNDPAGTALLEKVAAAGGCGFATRISDIESAADMGDFVEKVFFGKGSPLDTDGDGVIDEKDQCPNTPAGIIVDPKGCPLDTDGDGVYDYLDKCPGTPKGAKVDADGCWVIESVLFETAKWDIRPAYAAVLDNVIGVMKKNPGMTLEIAGHTDNVGNAAYNRKLSRQRCQSVRSYLTNRGIDGSRLSVKWYGYERPTAGNDNAEGRTLNRRVELVVNK